jgi:hypothetical protein
VIQHCNLAAFPAISCLQRRDRAVSHPWHGRGDIPGLGPVPQDFRSSGTPGCRGVNESVY